MAPPFTVVLTDTAAEQLGKLNRAATADRYKKAVKALRHLRDSGPQYPGLHTHKIQSLKGLDGRPVYQSYVENRTPQAYRVLWQYGDESDLIQILAIVPHPD